MTATVLLIRHGSHDRLDKVLCGRMSGVGLSEAGHAQAARLGTWLRGLGLSAIYASPLQRAQETAAAAAEACALPVRTEADLNEMEFGDWSGRRFDALEGDPGWARWNRLRHHSRPPSGETLLEAQVRAVGLICRLAELHPNAIVAAVTHSEIIKTVLAWALGLSLEFHARFEVSPASVSRLAVGDWGAKVWSINEVVPCP